MDLAIVLASVLISASNINAGKVLEYRGEAKSGNKLVYIEKHKVRYSSKGDLLHGLTRYERPDGSAIAELESDFRSSLTTPNHKITYFKTGEVQGLRRQNDQIVLYYQEKDRAEKKRLLDNSISEDKLLVGCQGLHYFLVQNLSDGIKIPEAAVRFLIPGKLDYYDFTLVETSEAGDEVADFELAVNSWFLRLFAPKLYVKYERKTKRLVWYKGLSNIKDDNGRNQNVTIEYFYDS